MDVVSLGSSLSAGALKAQMALIANKVGRQSQQVQVQAVSDAMSGAKQIAASAKGGIDILA